MKTFPILEKNNSFYSQNQFPTSETLGRTGTSLWRSNFWCSDFWVFLVDKKCLCLSSQVIVPEVFAKVNSAQFLLAS